MELAEFAQLLRTELPRLLREHPEVRHEVWGILLEVFPSRQEFAELVAELRAFREDSNRRFEAMQAELRALREDFLLIVRKVDRLEVHISALSGRLGRGLEHIVQGMVEEFAGERFPHAERLVLTDTDGELYGVKGAQVEFDLLASDGSAYLVEVKSHIERGDVLDFHRKAVFAAARLGRPVVRLMIGASMESAAEDSLRSLDIKYIVRSRLD